jgi:hypothetical protein
MALPPEPSPIEGEGLQRSKQGCIYGAQYCSIMAPESDRQFDKLRVEGVPADAESGHRYR